MLFSAIKAKLAPYLVPVVLTLVAVAAAAFWWLWNDRDQLLQKTARQAQIISNAAQANRENIASIKYLKGSVTWREAKAIERQQRARRLEDQLAQTREELKKALQDAPDCIDQPWPDAVFDIMRRDTVLDPNRGGAGTRASGVPAANPSARAGG